MGISRRKFFEASSAAAVTAGLMLRLESTVSAQKADVGYFEVPVGVQTDPLAALTFDMWTAFTNTTFSFHATSGKGRNGSGVGLVLKSVTDVRPAKMRNTKSAPEAGEAFSLTFTGPRYQPLTQETYRVTHDVLGSFSLMITVVGSSRREVTYEAIINRLRP